MFLENFSRDLTTSLKDNSPQVLAITGNWGTGKTHFIKEFRKSVENLSSCYVSVFGLQSIQEIRRKVSSQVLLQHPEVAERADSKIKSTIVGQLGKIIGNINHTGIDLIHEWVLSNSPSEGSYTLFLDDIERCKVDVEEILGFIDNLRETARWNVVLIFNRSILEETDANFGVLQEKAIDRELTFSPQLDSVFELLVNDLQQSMQSELKNCIDELGIQNIRIVKRIVLLATTLLNHIDTQLQVPLLHSKLVSVVTLAAWARFDPLAASPISLTLLESYNGLGIEIPKQPSDYELIYNSEEISQSEEELTDIQRAKMVLKPYGYEYSDGFERFIIRYVRGASIDIDELNRVCGTIDSTYNRIVVRQQLEAVWSKFHNNIHDNGDELLTKFVELEKCHRSHITLNELDNIVRLLFELGYTDAAHEMIEGYLAEHRADIEAMDNWNYRGTAHNTQLIAAIQNIRNQMVDTRSLSELAEATVNSNSWYPDDFRLMANKTAEDYAALCAEPGGVQLARKLARCAEGVQDSSDERNIVQAKMRKELMRLAKQNKVNEVRFGSYIE